MKKIILFAMPLLLAAFTAFSEGPQNGPYYVPGSGTVSSNNIAAVGTLGNNITGSAATATNVPINNLAEKNFQSFYTNTIVCWGDSITAGGGIGTTNYVSTYPFYLNALSGYGVTNLGVGGYSSTSYRTIFSANSNLWKCPAIIEIGVNDHTQGETDANWTNACFANIYWMVTNLASVGNSNYIVWCIPTGTNEPAGNATYAVITNFNGMLTSTYGKHVFDEHAIMLTNYNPANAQDVIDVGNDVYPYTFRNLPLTAYPWVHINNLGHELLARTLCNTILINGWNTTPVTSGSEKEFVDLWASHSPVLTSPYIQKHLNLIDEKYGEIYYWHHTNQQVSLCDTIDRDIFNIDNSPEGANQVYVSTHAGYMGVLGYRAEIGPTPWQVFGTNCYLYGVNTMNNITGDVGGSFAALNIINNCAQNASTVASFMAPNTVAGNQLLPFYFGVAWPSAYNAAYFDFNYVGNGSVNNYVGFTFYASGLSHFWFGNGNESGAGTLTNVAFIATGTPGFTGNGSGLTYIASTNIWGVTNASVAAAGTVGQVISTNVAVSTGPAMIINMATNITYLVLSPGDWDVSGNANFTVGTGCSYCGAGISTNSATIPTDGTEITLTTTTTIPGASLPIPRKFVKVSATTTVYLTGMSSYLSGTTYGYGSLTARRVR